MSGTCNGFAIKLFGSLLVFLVGYINTGKCLVCHGLQVYVCVASENNQMGVIISNTVRPQELHILTVGPTCQLDFGACVAVCSPLNVFVSREYEYRQMFSLMSWKMIRWVSLSQMNTVREICVPI